ncbi:MAG TPA: mechanosensitive ion channel family protein [Bryobacteraceae bacterium]|nr:mechanosensitive ion channel family protein [Bryobacteraceae bacterium]
METIRHFLVYDWMKLVVPVGVLALTMATGLVVKRLLFRVLRAWAAGTKSQAGLLGIQALEGPFMIWVLILGIHLATQSSELPPRPAWWSARILMVLWIASFTMVATRLAGDLIRFYGSGVQGLLPVTTLTQNLAQIGVVILGVLVLLNQLDISITPILTALGVGGLAVALALQDTLSNLFAGFYVAVSGQLRLGDYIRLSSGEEGYVADITWRSTTVRALSNNLIVIPNAKLGQAIVTNYHLPEKQMSCMVQVTVAYDSDPDHIERVLVEECREAARTLPGLLIEPEPFVRFDPGFGDSGLGFTLICQVREFVDQYEVRHELRKRILKRFRREGIEIPYPTRTLHLKGGGETDGQGRAST